MRTVTYGVANSLDGCIARADDGTDWLRWDEEVAAISGEYWKTIDTVLMGRRTYEVALRAGTKAYPGVRNIVFSRTLVPGPGHEVEIVADDAAEFTRRLKAAPGRGICVMGGGQLAAALLTAGLLDQIGVNIQPTLLGGGIPLIPPTALQVNLEVLQCRPLRSGSVYLLYRVKR